VALSVASRDVPASAPRRRINGKPQHCRAEEFSASSNGEMETGSGDPQVRVFRSKGRRDGAMPSTDSRDSRRGFKYDDGLISRCLNQYDDERLDIHPVGWLGEWVG
jgi:hypothetical protein